jgi:hypothetical protein
VGATRPRSTPCVARMGLTMGLADVLDHADWV